MPARVACVVLCLSIIPWYPAAAAALIEARVGEQPVRLVVDRPTQRVLMTVGGSEALFDLDAGLIYLREPGGSVLRIRARYRPGYDEPPGYRVEPFGPGPILAGNASAYHVLFDEERVCAELMLSAWMVPFVDPAIRAVALLEQVRPPADADACAVIPFATYAAAGWPLLAGKADRPTFETTSIRFDHQPQPEALTPPLEFKDAPPAALAELWPQG